MNPLAGETCEPFDKAEVKLDHSEIVDLLQLLPSWRLLSHGEVQKLEKTFDFNNFMEAMAFSVKVGELAETLNHHPSILTEWGRVSITWWTHRLGGLQRNDFILAAKTDDLYG